MVTMEAMGQCKFLRILQKLTLKKTQLQGNVIGKKGIKDVSFILSLGTTCLVAKIIPNANQLCLITSNNLFL